LDDSRVDDKYVKDICRMLNMEDHLEKVPKELSGGQKQRVAIARALAIRPAIILADEPTGNLDSKNRWDVFGLLKRASKEYEQTIVMITHDQELAMNTDKMYRIEDGEIVKEG
jgi:putative ABC transport system ATP-binding protein